MITYCLNKKHLEGFLRYQFDKEKNEFSDDNLAAIIEGAYNWSCEVNLIVYFFSSYAQRRINSGDFEFGEIDSFYDTPNLGNFRLQEFDREFIEYLFDHSRSRMKMTLEEVIVKIQEDLSDKNYASDFRYWYGFFH